MTSESDQPTPAPGGADPLDDTQPVEVQRFTPAPDPRPDTRWAWAAPEQRPGDGWAASPEAASAAASLGAAAPRTWASPATSANATWGPATGSSSPAGAPSPSGASSTVWATPAGSAPAASAAGPYGAAAPGGTSTTQRRSGPGVGTVAAVALLSAVLASTGTVLALNASGTFNPPPATSVQVPGGTASGGTGGGTGTTGGDDSAAVIASSARISPSVVKITSKATTVDPLSGNQTDGVGSGIIYDTNGWILTNHHVVTGADTLTVETKDGKTFEGKVYGIDTLTDLAIVKVEATGLPAASLGSSDGLKVGQLVVAVGSPLGTYSFSVTSGIVSGKGRSVVVSSGAVISNLIQTDAAINPGNSGGPLADATGNVVGINTAIADGSNGIGFAIPIDIAKPIMAQAVKGEKLQRPWIGVRYEAIDQRVKAAENLSVDNGALVINGTGQGGSAIQAGSPAEKAGLKDLDIILSINGIAIDQEHPLNLLLVQFAPGDTVRLAVLRDGQTIEVPITLGVRPGNLN